MGSNLSCISKVNRIALVLHVLESIFQRTVSDGSVLLKGAFSASEEEKLLKAEGMLVERSIGSKPNIVWTRIMGDERLLSHVYAQYDSASEPIFSA